jgi:hypothetical protein
MPPDTQLSTSPASPAPTPTPTAARQAPVPFRMSTAFAELILEDAPTEEFFRRFLLTVLKNSGAPGGAVWLIENKENKDNKEGQENICRSAAISSASKTSLLRCSRA